MALDEKWQVTCRLPVKARPGAICQQYMGRPESLVQAVSALMWHVHNDHSDQDWEADGVTYGDSVVEIKQLRWEKIQ